jgi:hypothetical protein
MYPDEASARVYLESRLWPNGVICPDCKSMERITVRKDGYYRCNAGCGDFTFRTGTIFERGHIPPRKLCAALFLFAQDCEISPFVLAEETKLTHKTAWLLLRDLREAAGDFFLPLLDLSNSHFRVLADFPAYRVGDDGSIWTRWRRGKKMPQLGFTWRQLNPIVNAKRGGYRNVILYDGRGKEKHERVCRLVCRAFHGPCPRGLECNHRDGNPVNDAQDNLFWGTHASNMETAKFRAPRTSGHGEANGHSKLSDDQVRQILSLRGQMERRNVAKTFRVTPTYISHLWSGRAKRLTHARLIA